MDSLLITRSIVVFSKFILNIPELSVPIKRLPLSSSIKLLMEMFNSLFKLNDDLGMRLKQSFSRL